MDAKTSAAIWKESNDGLLQQSCPKCGSIEGFDGPYYRNPIYDPEHLVYRCRRCFYERKEPCKDANKKLEVGGSDLA